MISVENSSWVRVYSLSTFLHRSGFCGRLVVVGVDQSDKDRTDIKWYVETYGAQSLADPDDQEARRIKA